MADDRSLKDVIRFLDPSGEITDADVADLVRKLKFTEVLDIITNVSSDNLPKAREILAQYDEKFAVAKEAALTQPRKTAAPGSLRPTPEPGKPGTSAGVSSGFQKPGGAQPIRPIGTTNDTQDDGQDLNQLLTDPSTKNKPEVRQIANLLQRMNK